MAKSRAKLAFYFLIAVLAAFYSFYLLKPMGHEGKQTHRPVAALETLPPVQDSFAVYADFSPSIKEMMKNSDLIIVGKPVSVHEQRQYGVLSKVEVLSTIKGEKFDNIILVQTGKADENLKVEGDVLPFNQNYILFLGKQEYGEPNMFYVKAGWQGAFLQRSDGTLLNNDATMKKEIELLNQNNKGKKESDALMDLIKSELTH